MSTEPNGNGTALRLRLLLPQSVPLPGVMFAADADILPKDTVIAAELDGRTVGLLALRLVTLVHDLTIEPGLLQRKIADGLLNYASGYVRASGPLESMFLVATSNEPMRRWLDDHGATLEDPAHVYTLEVL